MKVLLAYSVEVEELKSALEKLCPGVEFIPAPTFKEATAKALAVKPDLVVSHMIFDGMVVRKGKIVRSVDAQTPSPNMVDLFKFVRNNPELKHTQFVVYTMADLTMARECCPGAEAYCLADKPHSLKQLADTILKASE